jgi:hypothetical protein
MIDISFMLKYKILLMQAKNPGKYYTTCQNILINKQIIRHPDVESI